MPKSSLSLFLRRAFALAACASVVAMNVPSAAAASSSSGSPTQNVILSSTLLRGSHAVQINVGGKIDQFTVGSHITAGELIAIQQILGTGSQSIVLNASGAAVGGTFTLNSTLSNVLQSIVIPANVTAIDYFSRTPSLTVGGDLINFGSIYAASTNPRVTGGTIVANNIFNQAGGVISTQLPGSMNIAGDPAHLDLTLSATNNIMNAGTISSSGKLSLIAGGSLTNVGSTTSPASLLAASDINLISGSGSITNAGLISSGGNINVSTLASSTDININATNGTFRALAGNINIRNSGYQGAGSVNLTGGDYLSQNLNINSGKGTIEGHIGELTGSLNTHADIEHLFAQTDNLILGNNTVDGDPTFVNTGGITISGSNTFSGDVAILANGNVTFASTGAIVAPGFNVIIVAGVSPGASAPTTGTISGSPTSGATSSTTIDFASGSNAGGNITVSSGAATVIDTSNGSGNGGSVTLAALNVGGTGGSVLLGSGAIKTFSSTGTGGAINIFAGANPGTSTQTITTGNLWTMGQTNSGAVGVYTSQPTTSNPGTTTQVTFNTAGDITSGNTIAFTSNSGSPVLSGQAAVSLGNVVTGGSGGAGGAGGTGTAGGSAGAITIAAGSTITTNSLDAYGGGGGGGGTTFSGQGAGGKGGNGAAINVTSVNGGVTVNGEVNSSGGGGGGGGSGGTGGAAGGAGGSAAAITIAAAGAINVSGASYAVNGGAGGAGNSSACGAGGGGSFGGGGGGGAWVNSAQGGGGGGGGGGLWAGGGGGFADSSTGGGGGGGGAANGGTAGAGGTSDFASFGGQAGSGSTGGEGSIFAFPGGQGGFGGTLSSGGGGAHDNNFFTAASGGTANSTSSNVTVTGGPITMGGAVFGSTVGITSGGAVNLNGSVTGTTVNVSTNAGTNGSIQISNITASSSASIVADELGTITAGGFAFVNTPTLLLRTGGGNIGASGSGTIFTSASAITIDANNGSATFGDIFVNDGGQPNGFQTVITGTNAAKNYNFTYSSTGGPFGDIPLILNTNITGTSSVNITSSQDIERNSGSINTPSLTISVNSFSNPGGAGDFSPIQTNAHQLSVSVSTSAFGTGFHVPDAIINDTASTVTLVGTNGARNYTVNATAGSLMIGAGVNVTGSNSVTLTASGTNTIDQADSNAKISAGTVTLTTGGGVIGVTNPITTNAGTLRAFANNGTTFGDVNVFDTGSSVSLTGSNSGDHFNITMNTGNGSITIASGATVVGNTAINLITSGNGSINMGGTTGSLNTPQLNLTTNGGSIGSGNPILANAPSVTVDANNGTVTFGSVAIKDAAATTTLTGSNISSTFSLTESAANGSIVIGSGETLTGKTSVTLTATGTGTISMTDSTGLIDTPKLTLLSSGGDIGGSTLGAYIATTAGNITANSANGIALSGAGNVYVASNNQSIALVGTSQANNFNLIATNVVNGGSIALGVVGTPATVNGFSSVNLTTSTATGGSPAGSISMGNASSIITTPLLVLNTTGGDIGTGTALAVNVQSLSANTNNGATTSGNLQISNSSSLMTLQGTNRANNYQLTMSNAAVGSITIATGTTVTGDQSITLTAGGLGTIQTASVTGVLDTPTLTLTTSGGNIGSSAIYLQTNAQTVSANATANGSVFINDTGAAATISGTNAGNSYNFQMNGGTSGAVTVATLLSAGTSVTISAPSITVNLGAAVTAPSVFLFPNSATPAVVTNNGTIQSSASGILSIDNSGGDLSFAGNGTYLVGGVMSTSAAGNLDLGGLCNGATFPTAGGGTLIALAQGNIVASGSGSATISTKSTTGNAGIITIEAGVDYLRLPTGTVLPIGPSSTGGRIDLASGLSISIDTSSTAGSGGAITIVANKGTTAGSGLVLLATSGALTSGGTTNNGNVTITAAGGTTGSSIVTGTIDTSGAANGTGNISLLGAVAGSSGSVQTGALNAPSASIAISTNGNVTFLSASEHSLLLDAVNGTIALPSNSMVANPDASGNGGTVSLQGKNITYPSMTTTFLSLKADATGTGNGGTVLVATTSSNAITIGNKAGNYEVSAKAGSVSGNGGNVSISAGGNLTVNPTFLTAAPQSSGNGAIIALNAGSLLLVTSALSADGVGNGNGGSITLSSNSKTALSIGNTRTTNGVKGVVSVSGAGLGNAGTVTLLNTGGGITDSQILTNINSFTATSGNNGTISITKALGGATTTSIDISAAGKARISSTQILTADSVNLSSLTGALSLKVNTTDLAVNTAGAVSITNSNSATLDVEASHSLATFHIATAGDMHVLGGIAGANVTLKTNKTNGNFVFAGDVAATSLHGAVTVTTNGTGAIEDQSALGSNVIQASKLTFTTGAGPIGAVTPLRISTTNVSAKTTGTVSFKNAATGALSANTGNATAVNLSSAGNITLKTVGTSLTLQSAGSVTATDTNTHATAASPVIVGVSNSGLAFNLTTASSTQLDGITAGGALNVKETSGTLSVNTGASIVAGGALTLENSNVSKGFIQIGDGATIGTTGAGAALPVNIVLGPVPLHPVAGTAPTNVVIGTSTGGTAFYGAHGFAVPTGTVTLNLQGSNIVFNAGTRTSALQVGSGVVITADPVNTTAPAPFTPIGYRENRSADMEFVVDTADDDR